MRKPMLQAGLLAAMTVVGVWAIVHAADVPYAPDVPAARQPARLWALAGFILAAFGTWFGIRAWAHARLRSNLIASLDGLARWTVTPDQWVAITGRAGPAANVPVVIGQDAVVIGDACTPIPATGFSMLTYTRLSTVDWVEGLPGIGGVLLLGRMFSGRRPYMHFVRVPVPEGARGQAQLAIDGLVPLIPDEQREKAERRFEAELAAARGDPGGGAQLRSKRLLNWGLNTAMFSGVFFAVLSLVPESSGAPVALAPVMAGICAIGIGMMLTSVVLSR